MLAWLVKHSCTTAHLLVLVIGTQQLVLQFLAVSVTLIQVLMH